MSLRAWMLFGVLLILFFLHEVLAIEPESVYETDNRVAKEIFRDACRLSKYDCDGLKAPVVRRTPELAQYKINGLYVGGKLLWIDEQLYPMRSKLTIFHEIVHYLQFNVGNIEPHFTNRLSGCVVEREAYELTKQYAREQRMPEAYTETLEKWQQIYRCKVG